MNTDSFEIFNVPAPVILEIWEILQLFHYISRCCELDAEFLLLERSGMDQGPRLPQIITAIYFLVCRSVTMSDFQIVGCLRMEAG